MSRSLDTLDRVVAARPTEMSRTSEFVGPTERASIIESIFTDESEALDLGTLDRMAQGFRRRLPIATKVAGTAAAAALVGFVVSGAIPIIPHVTHQPSSSSAVGKTGAAPASGSGAYVRARLLDALQMNSTDILEDSSEAVNGDPSCSSTTFSVPFVPQPGQEFRTITTGPSLKCPGPELVQEYDITDATTAPFVNPSTPVQMIPDDISVSGPGTVSGYDGVTKTWWNATQVLDAPATYTPMLSIQTAVNPAMLRQQLAAGYVTVDGNETVDGQPTIKLTVGKVVEGDSLTLWVNSSSYLPVREDFHAFYGNDYTGVGTWSDAVDDFTFLPTTAANLANFDVKVPAGYTQVPGIPQITDLNGSTTRTP